MSPKLSGMVARYHDVLAGYLAESKGGQTSPQGRNQGLVNARALLRKSVRQLEELDRARARLEAEEAALEESRRPREDPRGTQVFPSTRRDAGK